MHQLLYKSLEKRWLARAMRQETTLQSETAKDAATQPLPSGSSRHVPGAEARGLMLPAAREPAAGEDPRAVFPHQSYSGKSVEVPNVPPPCLAAVLSCAAKGWWVNTCTSSAEALQGSLFSAGHSRTSSPDHCSGYLSL